MHRSALETVKREVREEVGFLPSQYDLVESRGGYCYDYPPEVLEYVREKRQRPFVRQEQEYFPVPAACECSGAQPGPSGVLRLQVDSSCRVQEGNVRQGAGGFLQCLA